MVSERRQTFVVLEPEVPVMVRVRAARTEDREIRDPRTRAIKVVTVLVLELSEVNGELRQTELSLTSRNAQDQLQPWISSGELMRRRLQITLRGHGYATEYETLLL